MPFDASAPAPAHTAWSQIEAAAMAYARRLDVLLTDLNASDSVEDALLRVGELLGGLSYKGFAHDLEAHLARVEEDLLSDAPRHEYNPGMGGNDPSQYRSSRLDDMIACALADDAADWLASAQEVMGRLQLAEAA